MPAYTQLCETVKEPEHRSNKQTNKQSCILRLWAESALPIYITPGRNRVRRPYRPSVIHVNSLSEGGMGYIKGYYSQF